MTSDLSCFLLFSFSFQCLALCHSFPSLWGDVYTWTQVRISASLGLCADGFSRMERVWRTEWLCSAPAFCQLSSLGGKKEWKLTENCVRRREKTEEEGKYTMPSQVPVVSVVWLHFHCCVLLSLKKLPKLWRKTYLESWKRWHVLMCGVHEACHFSDSGSDFVRIV